MLRAVIVTQYRRVTDGRTDGQTDGFAIASTALAMRAVRRAVKRSSITLNKNSTQAFQRAIKQGSTPPLTSSKWDKVHKFVVFWTISTIQDEKSAAKFHYIKTVSGKVVAQAIAFRVESIYWQGDDTSPLKSWLQGIYPLLKAASFDTFCLVVP